MPGRVDPGSRVGAIRAAFRKRQVRIRLSLGGFVPFLRGLGQLASVGGRRHALDLNAVDFALPIFDEGFRYGHGTSYCG